MVLDLESLESQARELFKNAAEVVSRYAEVGPGDFILVAIGSLENPPAKG